MKKIVILFLLLLLTGCKSENNTIPVILYNMSDPYIEEFADNITLADDTNYSFKAIDSENNQLLQNEQIEAAFKNNPKVMLVNPVDRLGSFTIINKAKEHEVPLIFFNREPLKEDLDLWDQVYYVGALAADSAKIQASIVADAFGTPTDLSDYDVNDDNIIQLVVLKGEQGHQDAETRTSVVIDELEKAGYTIEILAIQVADWQTSIAYSKMISLIELHGDKIELVISNNDAMAIGAISALKDKALFQDTNENKVFDKDVDVFIPVIGIDGISLAIDAINSGFLYGTVLNDSKSMAEYIVELAEALANGENLDTLSFDIVNEKYIWVDYKKYETE